jgi:hypothetical protein
MQFMGMDGFVWFTGVVEDRDDPMRLGRVRTRIFGLHSSKKTKSKTKGIPTEDLPWAFPMQPITSAAMNGIGTTPLGPVEGTHVVGFFRDGKNCQDPVIMGTLGGYPLEVARNDGFNDPSKKFPREQNLKEPDTNRRAVVDFEDPVDGEFWSSKTTQLDDEHEPEGDEEVLRERDMEVQIASAGDLSKTALPWDEPENPFAAEYPFNHVRESESGHVEEWDDTPDAERLMKWHKSGTFEEIHPDGTKVTKVSKDNYTILAGDDFVHVKQKTVDGYVVGGNVHVTVDGNVNLKVGGIYNVEVIGDYNIFVHGNWNVDVLGNTDIMTAGTKMDESASTHTIKGAIIHLNP